MTPVDHQRCDGLKVKQLVVVGVAGRQQVELTGSSMMTWREQTAALQTPSSPNLQL